MLSILLSLGAGALTSLSPCVLPALPIIMGSAASHRMGPIVLAAGMIISFTGIGAILGLFGQSLGLESDQLRMASAVLLIVLGLSLVLNQSLKIFSGALSGISSISSRILDSQKQDSLRSHFAVGALLGGIWSPCVGPTLGSAIALSSRGEGIFQATVMMFAFSIGAAIPLLLASTGFAGLMKRHHARLATVANHSKKAFGGILILIGILTVTGIDKRIEASVLKVLPQSWINFSASL